MLTHRFREQLESRLPSTTETAETAEAGVCCAFVPCPMFQTFSTVQQTQVQEIYRIAAERTREQLRRARLRLPQFSLN